MTTVVEKAIKAPSKKVRPAGKKAGTKKSGAKKSAPATRGSEQPSIREWLAEQLKKGPLPIADAIAYAEKTKRSKVTVYRMAAVCGARAEKGVFVFSR